MLRTIVPQTLETLIEIELPTGDAVRVCRRRFVGGEGPHVVIVAGVRGDTPEGTRVVHTVGRHLATVVDLLRGTVDLYPCVNPLAAHQGARNWPGFDLDLNRRFPGRADGHAPDQVAAALCEAMQPAAQIIEIRSAQPAFRQCPQARVRADRPTAVELAGRANVRCVWRYGTAPQPGSLDSVFPDMIGLEGGTGNRLTDGVGLELADGVLNVLSVLGVLPEDQLPFHWAAIQRPIVVDDSGMIDVRTTRGGFFLPTLAVWAEVAAGDLLGEVIEPISGEVREEVRAPLGGRLCAQREEPVVYPGNLVARIVAS